MKKSLIAILMTAVILLSLAAPLISILPVSATDPSEWYMTVNGVLDSDYYVLYPYETDNSLKIGFSKFGELINSEDNVGLEYGEVDPYAYPVGSGISTTVPKRMWVQGWLMNISYTHRTLGARNVWATAIHADSVAYGNDWIRVDFPNDHIVLDVEDPRDSGYLIYGTGTYGDTLVNGGRKTNGTAATDGIEILYDGPREFIAVCRTTIWDHLVFESNSTASDVALVQIAITIRFDKVKKDVVLLKDVKSLLVEKEGIKMKIQFSNRGEVDLGTATVGVSSYAHFYVQGANYLHVTATINGNGDAECQPTVYNHNWTIIQTEDPQDTEYPYFSAAGPYPQTTDMATYDIAQAINPGADYAWSAAFWPSLSDWSIDGWDSWWKSMMAYDPHYIDGADEEPFIPFYIGEWDFILYHTLDTLGRNQFRGVTQYSVTDLHDGDDEDMGIMHENVIDSEVQFYCNETFNPWDLNQAVHKDGSRYVRFVTSGTTIDLEPNPLQVDWDEYCSGAERLVLYNADGTGTLWKRGVNYNLTPEGVTLLSTIPSGKKLKILWSALGMYPTVQDNANDATVFGVPDGDFGEYIFNDYAEAPIEFYITTPAVNPNMDAVLKLLDYDVDRFSERDAVYLNGSLLGILSGAAEVENMVEYYVPNDILEAAENYLVQIFVDIDADVALPETITPDTPATWPALDEGADYATEVDWAALEFLRRYEWVTVGRDAMTVDSAGAALVAEAFDSFKQIHIGIGGADMAAADAELCMPSVMYKFGAGTAKDDYKDYILRAALVDDWCTYWPVASSNMIGIGGPIANLFAYYANDFTDAFYGLTEFSGTAYSGKIAAITCWDRNWEGLTGYNVYSSDEDVGYAVITTYKDINGTVMFNVWGDWGRDTYYASLWLHGDDARGLSPALIELQQAPAGVTSLILEIDYDDPKHPTYSVPEVLGTISERLWIHYGSDVTDPEKGGIHDP